MSFVSDIMRRMREKVSLFASLLALLLSLAAVYQTRGNANGRFQMTAEDGMVLDTRTGELCSPTPIQNLKSIRLCKEIK